MHHTYEITILPMVTFACVRLSMRDPRIQQEVMEKYMQDKRDALEAKSKSWYTAHPNSFIVPHHESAEQRTAVRMLDNIGALRHDALFVPLQQDVSLRNDVVRHAPA